MLKAICGKPAVAAVAKGVPLAFSENARTTVNLAGRTDLKTIAKSESPDVVLDAGYEACLDRVPVPAKP
ncbi:MAG: hypothetical protein IKL96_02230, partial [Kiritimatiellae bacterium]|nr:hypothetical protein [Kiritimatiellia bacterium]